MFWISHICFRNLFLAELESRNSGKSYSTLICAISSTSAQVSAWSWLFNKYDRYISQSLVTQEWKCFYRSTSKRWIRITYSEPALMKMFGLQALSYTSTRRWSQSAIIDDRNDMNWWVWVCVLDILDTSGPGIPIWSRICEKMKNISFVEASSSSSMSNHFLLERWFSSCSTEPNWDSDFVNSSTISLGFSLCLHQR